MSSVLFPTYSRHVRSSEDGRYATGLSGTHNTVRDCAVAYGSRTGLKVSDDSNLVENCVKDGTLTIAIPAEPITKLVGIVKIQW